MLPATPSLCSAVVVELTEVSKPLVLPSSGHSTNYLLGGQTTNSQLFPFDAAVNTNSIVLAPENANGEICLVPLDGKLDQANCDGSTSQEFTISQ